MKNYFQIYPYLTQYAQMGFINIASFSRYIKENSREIDNNISIAAIGMEIRRYLTRLPKLQNLTLDFSKFHLKLVTRSNLQELIFSKSPENRQTALDLFKYISKTKHFTCLVEGEKEIVLLTDHSLNYFLKRKDLIKNISYHTSGLGFISIDFPLKLRKAVGVYSFITSALMSATIPIHSFHTIGGEILIIVKNEDLIKTQETLTSSLRI